MKFLSDILAKAGLTVDGVVTLNNTATGQTPAANDNSTKLATTAWVRTFVQPYSLPIASASTLGGIKVGTGLSIDSGTGILSVTGASASSIKSTQTFVVTEGQTVFTVTNGYSVGLIDIFLNGVYLSPNQSTATNGSTFTLNDAPAAGDIIDVIVVSPVYQGTSTTTDQLPEGVVNLYYTNARARAAITLTVNGSSGASTYSSSTGVLNVPTYTLAGLGGIGGSGTTGYVSKFTNSTTIGNSLIYDNGFGIGINTSSPYNSSFYSLDVNGALLVKNVGKAANITLINADPAGGGNNAFVIHTVGGTLTSSYVDIQGYYGASVTGSTTIRLNAAGGNILIGSLIGTGTRMVVASSTGILSAQAIPTISDLSGVPTSRTLTINGVTYDLTANRSWSALPVGGTAGQLLAKVDGTDYNAQWIDEAPAASYTSQLKHQVKASQAISKGQAVYVSSADGTNMIVSKASNATEGTSSKTMGLLESTVSTNGFTNVIAEGLLSGLDTTGANAAGDPVWLGTDGNLIYGLTNKPSAPAHLVFIGVVTRRNANNGEIFVKVQNGFELDELHDLSVKNASDGDMIKYVASTGLWTKIAASTTNIVEGTNLYYTQGRFDTAFAAKSTTNLAEGTNLYYTDARVGTYLTNNSYATQTYVNTAVSNLVDAAPGTLDTLNELAAALGDDPNFATTVATSIGTKQAQLNGTGFVKVSGTTVSYDNSTYYLASNPSGYITGISFANVSAKPTTIAGYGITDSLVYTTSTYSNPSWITALAWSKITGAPAFITGYTETDTLATVTGRGASTSTTLNLDGRVNIGNGLTRPSALNSDSVAHARIGGSDVHLYVASLGAGGGYKVAVQAARTSDFASFDLDLQSNGGTLRYGGNEVATRTWVTSQSYLTGITSSQVTTALGYTPYNSSNPNGYITSSALSSYLPLSGGTMTGQILGPSIGSDVYGGAIQIRERGYVLESQSAWSFSPAITFHWGNRWAKRFGGRADGLFAIDDEPIALRSWVTSQGYITGESDTLATVTGRGASTSTGITINPNGTSITMGGGSSAEGIRMQASTSTTYPVFLRSINPSGGGETSAWIFKEADSSWGIWHNNPINTLDITRAPGTGIENNVGGGTNTVMIRLSHLDGSGQFTGSILNRVGTSILDQNGNIPGTAASETLSTVTGRGSSTSSDLTFNGTLTMGTSGTQYIRMGRFPASISNAGEAWIGRASDRSTGTTTLQLGGSTNGSRFEVVDHAWSQVIFEAGMNVIAYKGNNIWHAGNFTPSSYLPLSGGTMTGDITMSGSGRGIYFTGGNNRIYFAGNRAIEGNGVNLQIGEGHSQTQIQSAITQIDGNLYIANNGGRLYFDRPNGATVGGVGWHTNDVFYLGGHPDYGPGAGNHVRVYGFGSNLYLGNSTNGDVIGIDGTSGAVSIGRTTTLTAPLRFNESGYGRIAFTDNYHGMILRGIPNNAAGDVTATDVTSLIQHSGDFRFYRTNGSINELYFQVNATAPYWRGNTIYHTGNLTNLSQLTNGPGYITNNLGGVKIYGLGSLGANGTQTRRYEIARLGIDYNDWNSVGTFEVELHENYFAQGLKKVYNIWYGYVSNSGIRLVEQRGTGANNFRVVIGNEVVVSGDHRYIPVYVDVQYYSACNVIIRTNRTETTNSNTVVGGTYIFTSPSGTDISSFSLDETVEFTTHGSASVPGNFQTTSGSSYLRVSGIVNGSYIELSGNLPGYSNGQYPVIKSGGTIHFANNNKYSAFLEGANTYFGIMNSSQTTRVFLNTNGNSYLTGGNLGIGIVNPSHNLHVYTSANEGIFLQGTGGGVWMDMQVSGSNIHSIGAQVGGMGIYNRTSNLYRLFVTDAGNVSIGTPTSADVKLHVYTGNPSGATSLASNTAIAIDSNGNQYLEFRTRSDSAGIMQGILFTDNGRNAFIGFKEYTGAAANTYGESIHFAIIDFSASDAGSGFWWGTSSNPVNGVTSPLMFLRGNGNLNLGYGSDQGYKFAVNGTIYASGDVIAYSDLSVKKNIRTIDNALERVTKSRGVIYDRKDIESNNNIGFIAQELELEFPELISTNADGTKGVKYQNATAVLFEAVKEQQVQIEELKDLVKQLINR